MLRKSNTDVTFALSMLMEKFREVKKELCGGVREKGGAGHV